MTAIFKKWVEGTDGATAIEYGLIVAFIAVAISVSVFTFGESLISVFQTMGGWFGGGS